MPYFGRITTLLLGGVVALAGVAPAATSQNAGAKTEDLTAPTLTPRLKESLASIDKSAMAAKGRRPQVRPAVRVDPAKRAEQFAGRARSEAEARGTGSLKAGATERLANHKPRLPVSVSAVARGAARDSLAGRGGTGLGDIYEVESNDVPDEDDSQVLEDLPVNVVGVIEDNDVDFFAFTASEDEIVRIEVVADRIFGSPLDSLIAVYNDDSDELDLNDDAFSDSTDSFIRFEAPYSGIFFVGITDLTGQGDDDYSYVLNITLSNDEDEGEDEPNDLAFFADEIDLPGMMFGEAADDDDLDVFKFEGFASETLVVDIDAEIFLSEMDAVVELYDQYGRFLFGVDDFDGLDPRFNVVLPYTGRYYLSVYNRESTDEDFSYYSINISTQSAALAPRISSFKYSGVRLKLVRGSGFDPDDGGADVEINGEVVSSYNYSRRPTSEMRLSPVRSVNFFDAVTVVNPDGRRSNPRLVP